MSKKASAGKTILAVGAAAVCCGAALFALGETLSFMFRDVDLETIGHEPDELDAIADSDEIEDMDEADFKSAEDVVADPV